MAGTGARTRARLMVLAAMLGAFAAAGATCGLLLGVIAHADPASDEARQTVWAALAGASLTMAFTATAVGLLVYRPVSAGLRNKGRFSRHRGRPDRAGLRDPLSALPDRSLFLARLEGALSRAERRRDRVAVLCLNLDNFKLVNDSLGHRASDQLLVAVVDRMRGCLRPEDTFARLGGDRFTILLEAVADGSGAIEVAEAIGARLAAPFSIQEQELFTSASVGIAISAPGRDRPDSLLRNADLAMYHAKANGKGRHEVFDLSMGAQAMGRLALETDLRRALERGELVLQYQPVMQLATGLIGEVEALVRWDHPQRGRISPADFIPLAEETGLILPIGSWVLGEACRQVRIWQQRFPTQPPLTVSVNLSARQLQHAGLVEEIGRALRESGVPPGSLKLEITESAMMQDVEATIGILRRLKDLGIRLAIDDFGTGYSSLAYLKRLPVDTLKIDRSFVDRLGKAPEDVAIVRAVIAMAKTLNLDVTAEGIETDEQLACLRQLEGDQGQGYYLARPLSPDDLAALLVTGRIQVGSGTRKPVAADAATTVIQIRPAGYE